MARGQLGRAAADSSSSPKRGYPSIWLSLFQLQIRRLLDESGCVAMTTIMWKLYFIFNGILSFYGMLAIFFLVAVLLSKSDYGVFDFKKKFTYQRFLYYTCYAHYLFCKSVYLVARYPGFVMDHLKLLKNGKLVRLDLHRYFDDFCQDSVYPDQLPMRKVDNRNYIRNSGPLPLVPRVRRKERVFEAGKMHETAWERLIELLPSLTLFYFCKLSRSVYYQCLGLRGLEFSFYAYNEELEMPESTKRKNEMWLSKNGRRLGGLRGHDVDKDLNKFVLCLDTFRCCGGYRYVVHKTYRQLVLKFLKKHFNKYFESTLKQLLHDRVDTVKLIITEGNDKQYHYPPTMASLIKFLKLCKHVKKIGVSFHDITRKDYLEADISRPVYLAGKPDMLIVKKDLEEWARTRPDLELFRLIYDYRDYMIHDGKLKYMRQLMMRQWFLVEDLEKYNLIHTLRKYSSSRNHPFFADLECNYGFEPCWYYMYLM